MLARGLDPSEVMALEQVRMLPSILLLAPPLLLLLLMLLVDKLGLELLKQLLLGTQAPLNQSHHHTHEYHSTY